MENNDDLNEDMNESEESKMMSKSKSKKKGASKKIASITDSEESESDHGEVEDHESRMRRLEEEKFSHLRDEATLRIGTIGYVREDDDEEEKK